MREVYQARIKEGRCGNCSRTPRPGLRTCDSCIAKIVTYQKRVNRRQRPAQLITRYGITEKQFTELYEKQRGRCPICEKPLPPIENTFDNCVDHNHVTNIVRGILHRRCNLIVGFAQNPLIGAALKFVELHAEREDV